MAKDLCLKQLAINYLDYLAVIWINLKIRIRFFLHIRLFYEYNKNKSTLYSYKNVRLQDPSTSVLFMMYMYCTREIRFENEGLNEV